MHCTLRSILPTINPTAEFVNVDDLSNRYNVTVMHENPLILQFENFLSAEEMAVLRELGEPKMAPSTVRGRS